jgi:hypothetical protein
MPQPVGLGLPLSSNNRANINTALSGGGGNTIAGVTSINAQAGNLTLLGDASIDVTNIGSGQLQFSTAGNPQNVAAITCSSVAATGSVSAGGNVTGASIASTGALSGATLAVSGAATVGGQIQSANLLVTGSATVGAGASAVSLSAAPAWGAIVETGSAVINGTIANGGTVSLGALNALLAQPGYRDYPRKVSISCVAQPVTPTGNGSINSMEAYSVPAYGSGATNAATGYTSQNNSATIITATSGPAGARVTTFSFNNSSGVASDPNGLSYFWVIS